MLRAIRSAADTQEEALPDLKTSTLWVARFGPASRRAVTAAADLDPVSEDLAQRAIRSCADAGDADAVRVRLPSLRAALGEIARGTTAETVALAATITIAKPPSQLASTGYDSELSSGG